MAATTLSKIKVTRIAGFLGARVDGVDLARFGEAEMAAVRQAFDDHAVICVSGQAHASSADYVAFGERWGQLISDHGRAVEGHPQLVLLRNVGPKLTDIWHTDLSFQQKPPLATMLRAIEVPEAGGDTLFASQAEAYRQLSAGLQEMLGRLQALHVDIPRGDGKPFEARERAVHPMVREVEGEPALYINGMYTHQIVGLSVEESRPLLQWLFAHCTQPNFTFRHKWTAGDILIWDNRRVQHFAIYDYAGQERHMHRMVVRDRD